MQKTYTFCIAGHMLNVEFADSPYNDISLLPSFEPFTTKEDNDGCLFNMRVDDNTVPITKPRRERIDIFDTGNGKTIVDKIIDGGYQFIIKDTCGRSCCMLQCNSSFDIAKCALNGTHEMRRFGLNNAMMMMYAFSGSFHKTLLIHASLVRNGGYGYAFIAKSGTGKSTHSARWIEHIEGTDLMNDDNPIVRVINDKVFIYGSPWSGKTPCYRNISAQLGAIVKIERAQKNYIERMSPTIAFTQILPSCSSMKWDKVIYRNTYDNVIELIEAMPYNFTMHCMPDGEAAIICHEAVARK